MTHQKRLVPLSKIVRNIMLSILAVLFLSILFYGERPSFTGYLVMPSEESWPPNDLLPLNNTHENGSLEILPEIFPEHTTSLPSPFQNSSRPSSSGRSSGGRNSGGGSGSGSSTSPSSNTPPQNTGQENSSSPPLFPPNQNISNGGNAPPSKGGKILQIPPGLSMLLHGSPVFVDSVLHGNAPLQIMKRGRIVAHFNIIFDKDVDFSSIDADYNISTGKSFFHHPNLPLANISLYVPRLPGQGQVRICANASTYDEIYAGCSELSTITEEYVVREGDSRVTISQDGLFFIVSGITGTGGLGEPNGATINQTNTETAPSLNASGNLSFAGNVTGVTISAFSTTQSWQGYYGNVSGTIILGDSGSNQLYNWSLANPEGEVYASTNNSIDWVNVQCFNFTATGNIDATGEIGGGTNEKGTNVTQLEALFNIDASDVDGVDETFNFTQLGDGHDLFYAAKQEFSEGECLSTHVFGNTGQTINTFEEVLLYEPVSSSVIFVSLLEPTSVQGFDGGDHDFEMLVLEDGHGTDVDSTLYYFWTELE